MSSTQTTINFTVRILVVNKKTINGRILNDKREKFLIANFECNIQSENSFYDGKNIVV